MSPILLGVLAYLAVQFAVGIAVSRRITNQTDYFAAGRRLGLVLAAGSMFATWFGAESCVGAAGHVYEHGLDRSTVEPFAYAACLLVMGLVFAAPFWRAGSLTLADLFRTRYSPATERFAAILLIPTSVLWASAQIRAFGQVLSTASHLELDTAMIAATGVVILYTAAGGMMADVVTDLVQAVALFVGLAVLLVSVVGDLGGAGAAWEAAAASRPARHGSESWLATIEAWAIPLCGSVVAQEAVSRAVAARSPSIARNSALVGGVLYLAVGLIPIFLGLAGAALLPGLEDPEQILPRLAETRLGTFGYILFAGALISAILSTVDSTLLVASSLAIRNLLFPGGGPADPKKGVRAARLGVAAGGILAFGLARGAGGISDLVEQASGFASASILILVAFGLFTRFGGGLAAMASLVSGAAVWVWGRYLSEDVEHPYLVSLASALGSFLLVGLLERARAPRAPAEARP